MALPLPCRLDDDGDIEDLIARYFAALEDQYARLQELRAVAARLYAAAAGGDVDELTAAVAARDEISVRLTATEHRCRPMRDALVARLDEARRAAEFPRVSSLHREAERLVAAILAQDHDTRTALEDAEQSRRRVSRALEAGGASLIAYRRLIAPPFGNAEILNRRG